MNITKESGLSTRFITWMVSILMMDLTWKDIMVKLKLMKVTTSSLDRSIRSFMKRKDTVLKTSIFKIQKRIRKYSLLKRPISSFQWTLRFSRQLPLLNLSPSSILWNQLLLIKKNLCIHLFNPTTLTSLLHRSLSFKIERVINVDLAYYLIQNARTFSLALRVFLNLFLLDLLILAIVSK